MCSPLRRTERQLNMRRYHSQLYLRIYLALLASLALSGLLAALVWHVFYREPPVFTQLGTLARTVAIVIGSETETPAHYQQSLHQLHQRFKVGFALYDADGNLIGSAAAAAMPPHSPVGREGYVHARHDTAAYLAPVEGGRWLLVQEDGSQQDHFGFITLLALIAIAVAICAQPIVRRLTTRLERLKASVDQLGNGDLSSRVLVEGRDEIAAIAQSFNRSVARIEALMNSQRTLLANASHELRAPLARLRMSVELESAETYAVRRDEIQRNIVELDLLIDEILLASRLDSHDTFTLAKHEIDFTALLAEECARTRSELQAETVHLQGDARLLRRLIRNLLENSKRYGGDAPAEVFLVKNHTAATLEIADRGPGIAESEREKIFAPFYRLPNASESDGGVGLGLALVKQIAEKHGGNVVCLSRDGGGSRFVVTLPIG